jgi:hypothetical protein
VSTSACRLTTIVGFRLPLGIQKLLPLLRLCSAFERSSDSFAIWACTARKHPAPAPERCNAPLQPDPSLHLSKIEAEDLLDLLEGTGYGLCDLSYAAGEGFSVRPASKSR